MITTDPLLDVVGRQLHQLLCVEPDWDRCNTHGIHWNDARTILAAVEATGRLLPPGVIRRHERGAVYQDGHLLPISAERTIWETPWLPEKIADWERELLERQAEARP